MSFKQVHLSLSTLSIVAEKSKKLYVFDEISKLLASKYRLIWNLREDNLSCGNIIWNYSIFNIPERLGCLLLFFIFIISLLLKLFPAQKIICHSTLQDRHIFQIRMLSWTRKAILREVEGCWLPACSSELNPLFLCFQSIRARPWLKWSRYVV